MDDIVLEQERTFDMTDERPGDMLRSAREQRGMTLAEVAEQTRIAQRQLEAIERNDFSALPGTPYAVGFARAYARAVGADEVAVARGVREELGMAEPSARYEMFEPVDPARIPPRKLAWTAAALALLLGTGYAVWRTQFFAASTDQEISDLANRANAQSAPGVAAQPGSMTAPVQQPAAGPVVITAVQDVWLRIYDAQGTRLLEKQMIKGESYTVPEQANNPMILTGRPDALSVTVGGKLVPPLGPPERTIADVPISAAALLARVATQPVAVQGSAPLSPVAASGGQSQSPPVEKKAPVAQPARGLATLSPSTQRELDEAASAGQ